MQISVFSLFFMRWLKVRYFRICFHFSPFRQIYFYSVPAEALSCLYSQKLDSHTYYTHRVLILRWACISPALVFWFAVISIRYSLLTWIIIIDHKFVFITHSQNIFRSSLCALFLHCICTFVIFHRANNMHTHITHSTDLGMISATTKHFQSLSTRPSVFLPCLYSNCFSRDLSCYMHLSYDAFHWHGHISSIFWQCACLYSCIHLCLAVKMNSSENLNNRECELRATDCA